MEQQDRIKQIQQKSQNLSLKVCYRNQKSNALIQSIFDRKKAKEAEKIAKEQQKLEQKIKTMPMQRLKLTLETAPQKTVKPNLNLKIIQIKKTKPKLTINPTNQNKPKANWCMVCLIQKIAKIQW